MPMVKSRLVLGLAMLMMLPVHPSADGDAIGRTAGEYFIASLEVNTAVHSEYSCSFPSVGPADPAVAVMLTEDRSDGQRESKQWFFSHADTRSGVRYSVASNSGTLTLPSIATASGPEGVLFSASDFEGPTRIVLLWAGWNATVRCSWTIDGETVTPLAAPQNAALLFSQGDFEKGVSFDSAIGGASGGGAVEAELVRQTSSGQVAFLYDGGQVGAIRRQMSTVEIEAPGGHLVGNHGLDPWVFLHSKMVGEWRYMLKTSLGSTGALWLFSLPL